MDGLSGRPFSYMKLFIDGKNTVYRAIYANKDRSTEDVTVVMRFISAWITKFKPSTVHIFWDTSRETVWRRKVFPKYKNRETPRKQGSIDVSAIMPGVMSTLKQLFAYLPVWQYYKSKMEADDLIYAACRVMHPQQIIIVSSDGDFCQIPHFFDNVKVYEPKLNKMLGRPLVNPVIKKVLMGDVSDCIDGFQGIGEVKSESIARSPIATIECARTHSLPEFYQNLLLVDLALCPYLMHNQAYIFNKMREDVKYDMDGLSKFALEHKILGLYTDMTKLINPFTTLRTSLRE